MVKGGNVGCPVNDMKKVNCSRSWVEIGWSDGRENKGKGTSGVRDADGQCGRVRKKKRRE